MADYINPEAIRPAYDWKPKGFLAGQNYSQDRQRYEDVSSLQDYMMKNTAIESGAKLEDYFKDAPVREAERGSKIATSNATRATIGREKEASVRKTELDNELTTKTMASKIAEAASKAAIEGDKSQLSQLATGAAIGRALSMSAGPGGLANVMKQLEQSGADPRVIQWFSQSRTIEELQAKAKMMTDAFMQANEHYRSTMDANEATNKSRLEQQRLQNEGQLALARERARAKVKSIDDILASAGTMKTENIPGMMSAIINDDDATLTQKQKAQKIRDDAIKALNLKARSDPQGLKGPDGQPLLPPDQPRRFEDQPGAGGTGATPPNVIDFKELKRNKRG